MRTSRLAVAALAVALAASATALAGNGYRVKVGDASTKPAPGATVSVMGLGFAPHKARLALFLDRKSCRSTWASEAKRVNARTFKAGQSYFRTTREAFITHSVTGQFDKAFPAVIGTKTGLEHVCAYLTTRNAHGAYTVTAASGSAKYTVTG